MRLAVLIVALLVQPSVYAQIYIDYPDGTTYTVKPNESVYVTPADVFMKNAYRDGGVYFKRIHPSTKRDAAVQPPGDEEYQVGSHEWCLDFDTTAPYSFDTASWQRYCDTNGDGVYNGDDTTYGGLGFGG